MAAKLESSKSDLRHAEERLVAAVRARKELQAKLEEFGSSRLVGHSTVAAWPPPLAQCSLLCQGFALQNIHYCAKALPCCFRHAPARLPTLTCAIQWPTQVPTDADYERWGEEIKEAIRRVVEKDESEDVIEVLEGAAMVARAAMGGAG